MSGHDRQGHRREDLGPDADAMTLLSRALEMARRRLRYRVGAALIVAATAVTTWLLVR